ncbi:receptor-type tyrosine-protein phosphatase S-like [Branchiostoma lanceolatum]|uniref:receptor-type tyrosine-protein phosphatase S-like n=1 Tax=Branchiostoma lanceolatum TaxID=7740 RepID=UPI003455FE8E
MGWKERVVPLLCVAWLGLIAGVEGTIPPQDCADLFATGTRQSGTYTVGEPSPYQVYCDMSFLGGGWTVLQRRQDGSLDFAKTWEEYQEGFGDLGGEFWLGLDKIHTLTTAKSNMLQIELEDFDGERRYARYGAFSVGDSTGNYVATISGYVGDAGDSLTNNDNNGRHNISGRMFSTIDRDNDANRANCASSFSKGGWWYPASCGLTFLNGRYACHQSSVSCGGSQGVVWVGWGGTSYFLKKTTIMIRPAGFTGSDAPQDCADLYQDGIIESGVNAVSDPRAFVYCDMSNSGGGWTMFQRRQDGSVDFAKNWAAYEAGFGNLEGEHWLGLNKQNQITGQKTYTLRVDLEDWEGQSRYATYSSFSLGDSTGEYVVSISGYSVSSDAGDSLTSGGSRFSINGLKFTTSDNDNDPNVNTNCASRYSGGGWWYPASCGYALLNGEYNNSASAEGVNWERWRGYAYSLKTASLKIRPDSFPVCTEGTFGSPCTGTCHCLNGNAYCNHVTGACLGGCADGWAGSDCQTASVPPQLVQPTPADQTINAGELLTWTCKAAGDPLPTITWWHGRDQLTAISTTETESGVQYTNSIFSINAVNRGDNGAYSCIAANIGGFEIAKLSLTVHERPDPPMIDSGLTTTPTSIAVTWTFPYIGNLLITQVEIQYREAAQGAAWTPVLLTGSLNDYAITGLHPFTVYSITISAGNNLGFSDLSETVNVQTSESTPGKVRDLQEVGTVSGSQIQITLTWDSPDPERPKGIILHYKVAYAVSGASMGAPETTSGNQTMHVINGVTAGSTYLVQVWGVTSAGDGEREEKTIVIQPIPNAPSDVEVTNVRNCACVSGDVADKATLTVAWAAPEGDNGDVMGYRIYYVRGDMGGEQQTTTTDGPTGQLDNLDPNSKYTVTVAAYNSLFTGAESQQETIDTADGCPGPPMDVNAVRVINASAVSCNITWDAPAVTNGDLTKYKIHYRWTWNQVPDDFNVNEIESVTSDTVMDTMAITKEVGPNKKLSIKVSAATCHEGWPSDELEFVCINPATAPPPPPPIPDIPQDEITSSSFKMDIQRASSENGPICCYQIIVVPMKVDETLDDLRNIGLREATVLTSNDVNAALGGRDLPYVADAFSSAEFTSSITVGNGQACDNGCCTIGPTGHPDDNVHNKPLKPNTAYTVTVRAFSVCGNGIKKRQTTSAGSDTFTSSEFTPPQKTEGSAGPDDGPGSVGPVVGAIVGVVAVAAIIAGIIVARRKGLFNKKRDSMCGSTSSTSGGVDNLAQLENLAPDQDPDHAKPPIIPRKPEPKKPAVATAKPTAASVSVRDYRQPIQVECMEQEFDRRHANDDQLFTEEYKALPGDLGIAHAKAYLKKANGEKNRFKNVIAYDNARVVLTPIEGEPDSDYIHASYIDGYNEDKKFIAAQGPKPNTVHDFWRMMWETGSTAIVMVTNLEEKGKTKCTKYWPDSGEEVYGQITVTLADTIPMVYYVTRVFLVSKKDEKQRKITQFQFLGWPDFGAPRNPAELLKFHQKVMTSITSRDRPIVVHCSAGVGRTGTFITMDAMLAMMAEEGKVDVFGYVSKMRQSRSQMVQAEAQYVFIYRALLEQHLYGDTEIEVTGIHRHLQNLKREDQHSHKTGMELEYEKLTRVPVDKANMRNGNLPENISKNRVLQVLPYDTSRVFLQHKTGVTGSDYINASFIDGYRERDAYIATQGPLDRTVEDFWRMVWEWNSCSIVMLTELQEKERSTCARYWPEEGSKTFGDLTVRLDETREFGDFTHRTFSLEDRKGEKNRPIHQFHFHGWPQYGVPDNAAGIIDLIGQVQKQQQLSGNGPITVHCSSGAGRTGTFCAISTVLERVKTEGNCDVFQTVKALRQQRPHMVQTIDQYQFCYQAVVEYLDSFDHYSNFA